MRRIRESLEVEIKDEVPHWTLHDLRRTMATGLHYYNEKRAALTAWSHEIEISASRFQGAEVEAAAAYPTTDH